jgi:hypothetical protein
MTNLANLASNAKTTSYAVTHSQNGGLIVKVVIFAQIVICYLGRGLPENISM